MNDRIKTRNQFSLGFIFFILLTTLFLSACNQKTNKNLNLEDQFIDTYKLEIKMKIADINKLFEIDSPKYYYLYSKIKDVQLKFDSIYSLVEKNNQNINPLLKEIYSLTKMHNQYNTLKKIEIILNANTTSIDSKELQIRLLELNSTIISQIRYDIDRTDYRFNKIRVLVIPKERLIKLGETYNAIVAISVVDSTLLPNITYENQSKEIKVKHGYIQIKGETRGKFKSKGNVELTNSEVGKTTRYPFEFEFEVK